MFRRQLCRGSSPPPPVARRLPPRKNKHKVEVIVERTKTGYAAHAALLGLFTEGNTVTEVKTRMVEATNEHYQHEGLVYTADDVELLPDLAQFFDFYRAINPDALAIRIGMSAKLLALLVSGNRKPTPQQASQILKGLQDFGRELASLEPL